MDTSYVHGTSFVSDSSTISILIQESLLSDFQLCGSSDSSLCIENCERMEVKRSAGTTNGYTGRQRAHTFTWCLLSVSIRRSELDREAKMSS